MNIIEVYSVCFVVNEKNEVAIHLEKKYWLKNM